MNINKKNGSITVKGQDGRIAGNLPATGLAGPEAAVTAIQQIRDILYPGGDLEHEWSADELERIAEVLDSVDGVVPAGGVVDNVDTVNFGTVDLALLNEQRTILVQQIWDEDATHPLWGLVSLLDAVYDENGEIGTTNLVVDKVDLVELEQQGYELVRLAARLQEEGNPDADTMWGLVEMLDTVEGDFGNTVNDVDVATEEDTVVVTVEYRAFARYDDEVTRTTFTMPAANRDQIPELVFEATNLQHGELWDRIKGLLPRERTHTSLSIGDVVYVDLKGWYCDRVGWTEL